MELLSYLLAFFLILGISCSDMFWGPTKYGKVRLWVGLTSGVISNVLLILIWVLILGG